MSIGASPSLKTIADLIGDIAPHSMSEMYGINFADGSSSPASGTISLSSFRNKNFDTTAPVITLVNGDEGTTNYTVQRGTTYVDPGATADGGETVTVDTSELNMAVSGTYTVTYSATDLAGNIGTASRTVIVTGLTETFKLLAPDAAMDDYFGQSVAISGDYAVVGAYNESYSGSAYIFHRTAVTNTWDDGTKIRSSDAAMNDYFAQSVAISGDYVIVGARGNDDNGGNTGSAYIFHRLATNTWDGGTKILAPLVFRHGGDLFGTGVGISGDYAIVGAPYDDDPDNSGSAYIFRRTGTNTWDEGTRIVDPDAVSGNYFGVSVGISGDYAIVGATGNDGSVYIFRRTGTNTWDAGTKILTPDATAYNYFAISVAISGDYAIVGFGGSSSNGYDLNPAYIFHRTGTNTWDAGTEIVASDAGAGDMFGTSGVSISGDYAVVGATGNDDAGIQSGSAYIFRRTGTNDWDGGTKIAASDAAGGDYFGRGVDISGNIAIVGAQRNDDNGISSGSAYIFDLT